MLRHISEGAHSFNSALAAHIVFHFFRNTSHKRGHLRGAKSRPRNGLRALYKYEPLYATRRPTFLPAIFLVSKHSMPYLNENIFAVPWALACRAQLWSCHFLVSKFLKLSNKNAFFDTYACILSEIGLQCLANFVITARRICRLAFQSRGNSYRSPYRMWTIKTCKAKNRAVQRL